MELLFGVSGFGKIENAEIALGGLTLFVGDNNSGKTFLMQLLYGLLKELGDLKPTAKGVRELSEDKLEYGEEWFVNLERQINRYLMQNKERIIRNVFYREIPVERLYLRFINAKPVYHCKISDYEYEGPDEKDENAVTLTRGRKVLCSVLDVIEGKEKNIFATRFNYYPDLASLKASMAGRVWRKILWGSVGREGGLFLPASRTGLQLLGKYFFAERDRQRFADGMFDFGDEDAEDTWEGIPAEENDLGLTSPVYDFLQFLLRYNPRPELFSSNKNLIRFIEKHLIDGKLNQVGEETFYQPEHVKKDIPLYLASSVVNEMAPLVKVLSGRKEYRYLFYDEIETCLHPLKQGEMARLVIRLVSGGWNMVVSTHSDTMASKLNNLLLLSFSEDSEEKRKEKLDRLRLDDNDLLSGQNVHVYQFVNNPDGSSRVQELEFQQAPYVGYDFSLFMENLDELYEETDIILE